MGDKQVRFVVSGVDKGAGATLRKVADEGESATKRIGGAFQSLGQRIGGEFGDLLARAGDGLESFGGKSANMADKISLAGGALLGVGGLLQHLGDKEKASSQQLAQAIDNVGGSVDDLEPKIDKTVHSMEKFGHSAVDTKDALTVLVNATHDPVKALALMSEVADLAASKHISLQEAATLLAKALAGNAKLFHAYGVEIQTNADGTKNLLLANQQLAHQLAGQASASSDTFTGRLKALRTEITDGVASWAQKYGTVIQSVAAGMTLAGPAFRVMQALTSKIGTAFKASGAAAQEGAAFIVASDGEITVANNAAAASATRLGEATAGTTSRLAGLAGLGPKLGVIGLGIATAVQVANDATAKTTPTKDDLAVIDDAANRVKKFGFTADQVKASVTGTDAVYRQFTDALKEKAGPETATKALTFLDLIHHRLKESTKGTTDATNTSSDALAANATVVAHVETAQEKATTAIQANKAALTQQWLQMRLTNDAAGLLAGKFDQLNGQTIDVTKAALAYHSAEDTLDQSISQNGRTLNEHTQAGRANLSAILAEVEAAQAHAEAVGKSTGSTVKATAAYNQDIAALRAHLIALHLQPAAIQAIIDKYAKVPRVATTKVDMQDLASRKLAALRQRLHELTDPRWTVTVGVGDPTFSLKGGSGTKFNAAGDDFFSGGDTMVAERETEIINLPRGSSITPLSKVHAASGGDKIELHYHAPVLGGPTAPEIARQLVGMLQDAKRYGYTTD